MMVAVLVSWGCPNKIPKTEGLSTTELYFLKAPESTRPNSRVSAGLCSLQQFWGQSFLASSSFPCSPEIFGIPCLQIILITGRLLPVGLQIVFSPCVSVVMSVQISLFNKDISHTGGHLNELILT